MNEWKEKGNVMSSQTIAIAVEEAMARSISHIVVATNTGKTAEMLLDQLALKDTEKHIKVVAVTHVDGFAIAGGNEMTADSRKALISRGCQVVTAAHALSGAERAISGKFSGVYPLEIMAMTLRLFGQGTKVALETSLMAMDAGTLPYRHPVIAIGGTGNGADTAVLLTPGYSAKCLESRIHTILCKPILLENPSV
jgi:hypothetical protein